MRTPIQREEKPRWAGLFRGGASIAASSTGDAKGDRCNLPANLAAGLIPSGYEREFLENAANPHFLTLVAAVDERTVACGTVKFT